MSSSSGSGQSKRPCTAAEADSCLKAMKRCRCTGNQKDLLTYSIPKEVSSLRRAGPYLIGNVLGPSPVPTIVHCLARRDGTDEFYNLKILTLKDDLSEELPEDRQGKMLIHTEYSLLSMLQDQDGVIHHHGLFQDLAYEERVNSVTGEVEYTGRIQRRLVLVLDCVVANEFTDKMSNLMNLQHYVIHEKRLTEKEAVVIFFDIVRIIDCLHRRNIVHRDLKLGNMVLNTRTRRVTITNFCLGKHLIGDRDLLRDQRGSPAYISPDVLSGRLYHGKPSDMWALGVLLYTMLYGQFPFYDNTPHELFRKIKAVEYSIPDDNRVSPATVSLIRSLLILDPKARLTAAQVLEQLRCIILSWRSPSSSSLGLQVVPDIDDKSKDTKDGTHSDETDSGRELESQLREASAAGTEALPSAQLWSNRSSLAALTETSCRPLSIVRLGSDARPLTPAEVFAHCHLLIPQTRPN